MRRYTTDGIRHDRPVESGGGAHQLATQLRAAAKEDPSRFVRLALRLPQDVQMAYPEAIIQGITETDNVPIDDVYALVRWSHDLPDRPCGRWISDPVARHWDGSEIPQDIIDLIAWYATEDPDPMAGEPSFGESDHGARMQLLNAGINTNRGRAAGAIARLLEKDAPLDRWRSTVLAVVSDPSDAVRACAAEILIAALRQDRDWAASAAATLVEGRPEVASSVFGERLLNWLTITHPKTVLPTIEALLASSDAAVARVGGRLACLAGFASEEGVALANRALMGTAGARLGAAEVYAANISDEAIRPTCRRALMRLFSDDEQTVRREAGTAFRRLHDEALGSEDELVRAFIESPALQDNPSDLVRALLESPVVLPDITVAACRRLIAIAGGEAGSIASAWSARMPDVAALAVRVHAYGTEDARANALDVIDALAAVSAYGLDPAIAQFDR